MLLALTGAGAGVLATAETLPTFYTVTRLVAVSLAAIAFLNYLPRVTAAWSHNKALVVLVGWGALSAAWSTSPSSSLSAAAGMFACLVFAAILATHSAQRAARYIVTATTALSLASLALWAVAREAATVQYAQAIASQEGLVGSLAGVFRWNSDMGIVAGIGAALATTIAAQGYRPQRMMLAAAVNVIAVLMSNSATALLATTVAVLVGLFAFRAQTGGGRAIKAATVAGLLLAVPLAWGMDLRALILQALGKDETLTGRAAIWEVSLRNFGEYQVRGTGLDAFFDSRYGSSAAMALGFDPGHLHNGYYQLAAELGLVGVAIVVVAATVLLARAVGAMGRRDASTAPYLAAIAFFAVGNLANNYLLAPHLMLALVAWAAFGLGQSRSARKGTAAPTSAQRIKAAA